MADFLKMVDKTVSTIGKGIGNVRATVPFIKTQRRIGALKKRIKARKMDVALIGAAQAGKRIPPGQGVRLAELVAERGQPISRNLSGKRLPVDNSPSTSSPRRAGGGFR
jgi:hypothetical protein